MRIRLLLVMAVLLTGCASARQPEVSTIAFGSCLRQDKPAPIFDAINARKPDVFVFIGDNVYADTEDRARFEEVYAQKAALPGFQTLEAHSLILATWDDHDFGKNDAGVEYPQKQLAKQIMLDFYDEPAQSDRRRRDGVQTSYVFGPAGRRVQVILLDTRWFRSPLELDPTEQRRRYKPTADTSTTILGPAQWAWLEEELRQPADLRIIASSIQVIPNQHKFELWGNFPHERERLLDLALAHGPTVIISGDRHFAEMSRLDRDGTTVWDVTSSSLNSSSQGNRNEPNPYRVGPFVGVDNFGMIEIDWTSRKVTLLLVDGSNTPVHAESFSIPGP
jgi:alkaline phosphatase D